ncbi:MAG: hypothetical protein IPF90_08405 [Actinomycetales bacterium]|nr:hypothetical protein [Candidatus Phosphoribacter baldrii]
MSPPSFDVPGEPGAIHEKAAELRVRGTAFAGVANGLDSVRTDGWVSLSADRFREKFAPEATRWREAGRGFRRAAAALDAYAAVLATAQETAKWAAEEYQRGVDTTTRARAAYDADVRRGRQEQRESEAAGVPYVLIVEPFHDPGQVIRDSAVATGERARAEVRHAGAVAAAEVRQGCAGAPQSRAWWETGLAFVGDIFIGLFEGLGSLVTLAMTPQLMLVGLINDIADIGTGRLTVEELQAKYQLKIEDAQAFVTAVIEHPGEVAKAIGKAIVDWDTWTDDPGKAIGHLIPEIVLTVATLGAGSGAVAAERGALGAVRGLENAEDIASNITKLDDLADLGKLDDAFDVSSALTREEEFARGYYTGSGYEYLNAQLRGVPPSYGPGPYSTSELAKMADDLSSGLSKMPAYEGTSYRGTNLPQSVLDEMTRTGVFRDPAFTSSSLNPAVAENFRLMHNGNALLEFNGRTGRDLSAVSTVGPSEAEILFDKGTAFEVVSKTWEAQLKAWKITLKELP